MKISILTPTYNRVHMLSNLYNSLIENKKSHPDFEWLIMDDGSTDDTEKKVKKWMKDKDIDIKYFKQKNQGKMIAINNLLKHITGEITVECDSDDYFTNDCFKHIIQKWDDIKDKSNVYGLALLKVTNDNHLIGNKFDKDGQILRVFDMYFKEKIEGDKCLVFKSSIRKQFNHKLEGNEHFVTEGRMFHEMDMKHEGLMCFNIKAIMCEYLDDGYSKNVLNLFKNNPFGYYQYYVEMFNFNFSGVPFNKRLHIIKHYILFSCLTHKKKKEVIKGVKGLLNKLLVLLLIIPGYLITTKKFK